MDNVKQQVEEANKEILADISRDIRILANRLGVIGKDETKDQIRAKKGYASRNMLNKVNYQVKEDTDGLSVELGTNAVSAEGFPYPRVYELGRRSGKGVSKRGQEQIVKWLKIKMRLGHFKINEPLKRQNKRTRLTRAERMENLLKGIAFIISQNIKKHGQKGHFVFKAGFTKMLESFTPELNRILGEIN